MKSHHLALLGCALVLQSYSAPLLAADSIIWQAAGTFHGEIEGPATDAAGNVYAVNFGGLANSNKGTIGKITPDGKGSLLLRLPNGSVGNGIVIDKDGALFIADYTGHTIWRYQHQQLSLYRHEPRMYQPNDLALHPSGVLFATDPDWPNQRGQLWRIPPAGQAQKIADTGTSNGVSISPDGKHLYVNESAQRRIWVYPLNALGQVIGSPELLLEFADFGLDGMRCDRAGNLYVARYGKGVIAKISPQGELLREYQLQGRFPTNVTLSPAQDYLYITMQQSGSIERIALKEAMTTSSIR